MENEIRLGGQPIAHRAPLVERVAETSGRQATLSRKPRPFDRAISLFLFLCGAVSVLTTIGFTIVLGSEAIRFFATTEWLNVNKRTVAAIEANATILNVTTTGSGLTVGDDLRLGQLDTNEIVEITAIIDAETIEVVRGVRGTTAVDHTTNTPLFRAADVSLVKFFTETRWAPQIGNFGVLPLLAATLQTSFVAMLVAIPLGLGAAIYLSEYARPGVRQTLKPILEILAGIPTVVYGYFALTFMTPLLREIFGPNVVNVYNMASAGIVMGFLILPTISSISEDAMAAVPRALREASYGLGATRLETVFRVILPSALSGISAAIILGISRAVGETMIVLLAAGAGPNLTANLFDNAETMAGHIARISTGDLSFGSIDYNSVFAIGLTLFIMTLVLNFASTIITRRFREVYS